MSGTLGYHASIFPVDHDSHGAVTEVIDCVGLGSQLPLSCKGRHVVAIFCIQPALQGAAPVRQLAVEEFMTHEIGLDSAFCVDIAFQHFDDIESCLDVYTQLGIDLRMQAVLRLAEGFDRTYRLALGFLHSGIQMVGGGSVEGSIQSQLAGDVDITNTEYGHSPEEDRLIRAKCLQRIDLQLSAHGPIRLHTGVGIAQPLSLILHLDVGELEAGRDGDAIPKGDFLLQNDILDLLGPPECSQGRLLAAEICLGLSVLRLDGDDLHAFRGNKV